MFKHNPCKIIPHHKRACMPRLSYMSHTRATPTARGPRGTSPCQSGAPLHNRHTPLTYVCRAILPSAHSTDACPVGGPRRQAALRHSPRICYLCTPDTSTIICPIRAWISHMTSNSGAEPIRATLNSIMEEIKGQESVEYLMVCGRRLRCCTALAKMRTAAGRRKSHVISLEIPADMYLRTVYP